MALSTAPDPERRDIAIGATVGRLRRAAGMTQTELANQMRELGWAWTQPATAKVELGKRPVRAAEASDLAMIFRVSVQSLLASPLADTLNTLAWTSASKAAEAGRILAEAQAAQEGQEALSEIYRASQGERVDWGDEPLNSVVNCFRHVKWWEMTAILAELGATRDEIDELGDPSDAAPDDLATMKRIWRILQRTLPTLHPRPE